MAQRLRRAPAPDDPRAALQAPWAHARANQRIVLAGVTVAYLLQRSRRRSIGFSVDTTGLAVRAPQRTALADIEAALRRKSGWIQAKLVTAEQRQLQMQAGRIQWQDGTRVPYRGRHLQLRVREATAAARPQLCARTAAPGEAALLLQVAPGAGPEQLAALTQRWLQARARELFTARLQHFAPQVGVRWQRLRLSSARTRWGSASTRGTISLHWRLIQLAPEILDYVVVHELAHLHEMNHSARFWAHVARVLPDYDARRAALRACDLPPW